MQSSRPYLVQALYQWLLDNHQTPYIVVDAEQKGVQVPRYLVQNGQIVLNIGPTAVRDLELNLAAVTFSASFGGQSTQIIIPSDALIAIYARENGVGMVFGHEPIMPVQEGETADDSQREKQGAPTLTRVSKDAEETEGGNSAASETSKVGAKKKPSLKVVK
ncbi:ClpXP protease specificity-enhancing factor [Pistricoccus aurantiacus]|uniref:ClpXP protease specificity-enhancing factor n=1 Tax=Pistricoccus aurantiacus TaxID=1883414 RepID=UPI003637FD93